MALQPKDFIVTAEGLVSPWSIDSKTKNGRHIGDAHQGLRIDCADGLSTLLEFRTAAEPRTLG